MQGLVAFVRAAGGVDFTVPCEHSAAMGSFASAGQSVYCGWLDWAEDQVHPGEGSA